MKTMYEQPELEIVKFSVEDIITESIQTTGDDELPPMPV